MAGEDWVAQIAAGDHEAFRAVYEKYGKIVYQKALEQTGSNEQAQIILKNVFRALFRQLKESHSDPILFLLEGLTDLQIAGAADIVPGTEQKEPSPAVTDTEQPVSAADAVPAVPAAPQENPSDAGQEPGGSLFDHVEADFHGEYDETALSPEELKNRAAAPADNTAVAVSTDAIPQNAAETDNYEEAPLNAADMGQKPRKAHRGLTVFLVILLVLLVLLTVWFGAGVLMMYDVIPKLDLGYSWFNQNLFNLFRF